MNASNPNPANIGDVNSEEPGSGARCNAGKAAFELVSLMAFEGCARVFDFGREKYAPWNWAKGMPWSAPLGCLLRHLSAWQRGEDNDPESGLPHLDHAMANLVMLTTYARTYPQGDDRTQWLRGQAVGHTTLRSAGATQDAQDAERAERAAYLSRWKHAPEWADWCVKDPDGRFAFFSGDRPTIGGGMACVQIEPRPVQGVWRGVWP